MDAFSIWLACVIQEQFLEMFWAHGRPETAEDKLELFDAFLACMQLQRDILDEQPELIK